MSVKTTNSLRSVIESGAARAAPYLLGCTLEYLNPEGYKICGRIVETESYTEEDPASHSFKGKTLRNSAMFASPGAVYVHFTYGMYNCFNISCGVEGRGEAVLIRAIEPIGGIGVMWQKRYKEPMPEAPDQKKLLNLTSGPAKLVLAYGFGKSHDRVNLLDKNSGLKLIQGERVQAENIVQTTRIGLTKGADIPWRWYDKSSKYVSKL